jgi:ubiquinone/menaquinone biosynthesis C-methylase UbiE
MNSNNLSSSYDLVYENEKIEFSDCLQRFPRTRDESLVKHASKGERVLEIGSGRGNVLYNLRNSYKELYGLELSNERAIRSQEHFKMMNINNVFIQQGNIETGLNFEDAFFDTILWADVIEHVVDLWSAMSEIKRLLKTNGRLVTCTPNIAYFRRRITLLLGQFPSTGGLDEGMLVRHNALFDEGHLHYFTFSSLMKVYQKYGIKPIERMGFGRLGWIHDISPSLLSGAVFLVGEKISE